MVHLDTILICAGLFFCPQVCSAQFYSVERSKEPLTIRKERKTQHTDINGITNRNNIKTTSDETLLEAHGTIIEDTPRGKNGGVKTLHRVSERTDLPELTIPNLLTEIKKNNIKYPKIVLAQAILETGWFKSAVCRNKHNLFGLTNPRTKDYYEFNHWTESVKAYYTKVQYRFYQKNKKIKSEVDYLIWLRDLPYATDRNYIKSIISVMKNL